MSQSDVATEPSDVMHQPHRSTWRALPSTVSAASVVLFIDATVTSIAAILVAGPILLSRLTGLPNLLDASAQAPMVWQVAGPMLAGATLALGFAGLEVWLGLRLRHAKPWSQIGATALIAVAFGLALVPGALGVAFHFSAWNGMLPGVKPVLLACTLVLVWAPSASREFFHRP